MADQEVVNTAGATQHQQGMEGRNSGLRSKALANSLPDTSGPAADTVFSKKDLITFLEGVAQGLDALGYQRLESVRQKKSMLDTPPVKVMPAISVTNGNEAEALVAVLRMVRNGELTQLQQIDPLFVAQTMSKVQEMMSAPASSVHSLTSKLLEHGHLRYGASPDRRAYAGMMTQLQSVIDQME